MKRKRGSIGSLSDDAVRRIREVFDARRRLPTDEELSKEHGLAVGTIRQIGRRFIYRDVP